MGHGSGRLLGGPRSWYYFPHDHARSRAYRWGEDGLWASATAKGAQFRHGCLEWPRPDFEGKTLRRSRTEGNHGEDVKECYYYLDATPTHSYAKGLYKYPHARFPYEELADVNRRRSRREFEYEITDTGLFDDSHYFDCEIEYAKACLTMS